ncbi:MAG: hypothetical protein JOY83_13600 [Alphaproteobacteria bacterium]|nr:hypothetical protein [Alphaproteobacteria bacterium]
MDLQAVREEAIEATTRALWDKNGFVPDQNSDEWEGEYRRQFDQAKRRHAAGQTAEVKSSAATGASPDETGWAVLTGAPTQIRWAAALRAERIHQIKDPGVRHWLATTWTKAKSWIDTREMPTPVFLQRIQPHYGEYRRQAGEHARAAEAEKQAQAAAAEALRREVEEAGITAEGLVELIDIAEQLPAMPIKTKLAELGSNGRNLRVFETGDPAVLTVLEKSDTERREYGIERDEGLVADLKLFARARELL